jgi:hypothetical protein
MIYFIVWMTIGLLFHLLSFTIALNRNRLLDEPLLNDFTNDINNFLITLILFILLGPLVLLFIIKKSTSN